VPAVDPRPGSFALPAAALAALWHLRLFVAPQSCTMVDLYQHCGLVYNDRTAHPRVARPVCVTAYALVQGAVLDRLRRTHAWAPGARPLRHTDADTLWVQTEVLAVWTALLWDVVLCTSTGGVVPAAASGSGSGSGVDAPAPARDAAQCLGALQASMAVLQTVHSAVVWVVDAPAPASSAFDVLGAVWRSLSASGGGLPTIPTAASLTRPDLMEGSLRLRFPLWLATLRALTEAVSACEALHPAGTTTPLWIRRVAGKVPRPPVETRTATLGTPVFVRREVIKVCVCVCVCVWLRVWDVLSEGSGSKWHPPPFAPAVRHAGLVRRPSDGQEPAYPGATSSPWWGATHRPQHGECA
jgi:hypothetical protein